MTLILLLSLLILFSLFAPYTIIKASQSLVFGLLLMLVLFLLDTIIVLPNFVIGSLHVYIQDLFFSILFFIGINKHIVIGKYNPGLLWLYLFGLCIISSFILGIFTLNIFETGVEFRPFFYFLVGTLYFTAFRINKDEWKMIYTIWVSFSTVLFLVASIRWVLLRFGILLGDLSTGVDGIIRVLNAGQALFLAQAFILIFSNNLKRSNPSKMFYLLSMCFFSMVVLLQHRSVWVATFVGIIILLLLERNLRTKILLSLGYGTIIGGLLVILLYGKNISSVLLSISASAVDPFSGQNTTTWRIESWQILLSQVSGIKEYLFGTPMGTGYWRVLDNVEIGYAPHNFYVQVFLRTGLFGILFMFRLYQVIQKSLLVDKESYDNSPITRNTFFILIIMQLIYYIPYSPSYEQSIVLGLALIMGNENMVKNQR